MKIFLSAFADEASEDFGAQIATLKKENIPYIELRGLDGKNVSAITESEASAYKKLLDESGIKVWSIGSPIGKISISDDFNSHLGEAEHIFRVANLFGTKNVRIFSFYTENPQTDSEEVIRRLKRLVELADKYNLTLCHENEKHIYGDTADRCLNLLNRVRGLKCVFDPANFIQCGENIKYAHGLLKDKIYYYHIKDALYKDGTVVPAGEGDGLISKLISEIDSDKVLTLEPHLSVFDGYSQIDRTELKNLKYFETPAEAFSYAAKALKGILKNNNFKENCENWEN